jgi:hypothetical protein
MALSASEPETVATPFAVVGQVENDRVSSLQIYSDHFGLMAQLGVAGS